MASERRPVLFAWPNAVSRQGRQMEQDCVSSRAFDQSSDCRTADPQDQIALPVAWNRAIQHRRGPLANQYLRRDERFTSSANTRPRDAQRTAGAQARGQLTA